MHQYDVFISYTQRDGEIAASLASKLHDAGVSCFMADRSILAGTQWDQELREALLSSERVLVLVTPRSKESLWIAAEAGAAWVLRKELIPVLMFVEPKEVFELVRAFQARTAETPEQTERLVAELKRESRKPDRYDVHEGLRLRGSTAGESFTTSEGWQRLVKVGEWAFEAAGGTITGAGMYRYLLSDRKYGDGPFTIEATIRFLDLSPEDDVNAVNAGFVLGWSTELQTPRYLHLMLTGKRLLLEQVGGRGGDEYTDFRHIDEGIPFVLHKNQEYRFTIRGHPEKITVLRGGEEIYSVVVPPGSLAGRVGLRPWRSVMICSRLDVIAA